MTGNYYDNWVNLQAAYIESEMRKHARDWTGQDLAVYVIPSKGPIAGRLEVAEEKPEGATDVVRFPAQGSRVMAVPYSHLRSLLWHACRNFPILPT